jgi:hypothetical protein
MNEGFMNKFSGITAIICLCLCVFGCSGSKNVNADSDPVNVLPAEVDDETDADIIEVPDPKPRREKGETVYPLLYGGMEAVTKSKTEWEKWLRDPSLAPLPRLHEDRAFVLTWCHQFAALEPEDAGLFLMNYFEYDMAYLHPSNPWCWRSNPDTAFFNWAGLRKCIEDKKLVCAGYAQLFYLIVKEKYPGVQYITSNEIRHARNFFEDEHWDITWLDEEGVDYNPDKIKFDFIGMQKRIEDGLYGGGRGVGRDWKIVNLMEGAAPW